MAAIAGLAGWALLNGALVFTGFADLPFLSLGLGVIGAGAVVGISALMASSGWFSGLRYCGRNSIVIYLAFFLPMAATRAALLRVQWIGDVGTMSVIVTAAGVLVLALGALFECQRQGVAVPDRLRLCGFGDLDFTAASVPTLTTVRPPRREIGRHVADLLLARFAGEGGRSEVADLGFELIARESG